MKGETIRHFSLISACCIMLACEVAPTSEGFDGARAFSHLQALVEIGPRWSGSQGAERTRDYISDHLTELEWSVREHRFTAQPPVPPPLEMINLIGSQPGEKPGRILFVTHYDTKKIEGIRFLGANDGASGVALMLELAEIFSARRLSYTVDLIFCDGEEALGRDITPDDGLYGSRALAEAMAGDGSLADVRALILVDMVADRDLNLAVDQGSAPVLRRVLFQAARDTGLEGIVDQRSTLHLVDDHTPFVERGVKMALSFIDFQYGARRTPGPYWHTAQDNLVNVSESSLNSVGRLVVESVHGIEKLLTERDMRPSEL